MLIVVKEHIISKAIVIHDSTQIYDKSLSKRDFRIVEHSKGEYANSDYMLRLFFFSQKKLVWNIPQSQ